MNNFFGIRGSETRIIKILEDLPLGIISFNADGLIDFVNPAFLKMGVLYRLKIPSLIDSNIFEKDIIPGISLIEEISELKKGFPFEKEIKNLKTADGSEISVIIKCSPVYENEQYAGGIIVLEDLKVISDSREEDLLKIESFKKVTNEIADLFFIVDAEGIINYSAGSLLKTLSIADPKKLNVVELIPDLPDNFLEILSEVRDKNFEKRIILNLIINNEQTYYDCFVNILSTKQPRFFTCTFINISDKIKSQNLKDRLNIFETVADITSDGIIGVNAEGIITLWSPSVLSLTGFLDEEVLGKSLWQFIPTLNQKSFTQLKEDLQQIHFFKKQILILNKAGNEIAVNASFLLGDDDNIIISLAADLKEIKPENFKTLEENFRNLVIKS
ncbi:MAG TPA: PAS domain-containing protein, partial [Ignavibacteriaceae bacterium]|nr:PAS domain-containing protein [Ignavibacteriaceae bacterium]